MANKTPERLATMCSIVDAQVNSESNVAQMLAKNVNVFVLVNVCLLTL